MLAVSSTFPSITIPRVPIMPVFKPPAVRIFATIDAVVVLPLVPVMPIVVSSLAGLPKYSAETKARAFLVSSTLITSAFLTSTSSQTSTAAAPPSTADCANLCPSKDEPLRQTKRLSFCTLRESYITSEISVSRIFSLSISVFSERV